jgi:hypothetical protein
MADALVIDDGATIRPNPRVEHRTLAGGEAVLLHLDTAAYHGLNQMGEAIWESLGGGQTFGKLVEAVRALLDETPPQLRADLEGFVRALADRDLVLVEHAGDVGA